MIKKELERRQRIISEVLDAIRHPESGEGLVAGGFVSDTAVSDDGISVMLKFRRRRDPFAASLRRQAEAALTEAFRGVAVAVSVAEEAVAAVEAPSRRLAGVRRVVAVASGKGGVGKSTLTAHLAVTLAAEGYRVGVLDADIYGPSQPMLFGVADYMPPAKGEGDKAVMTPAESRGVKIMSIGFFIAPSDALVWRGPMATGALRQLIRQTEWGELDFLLIDLPPGTGDILLSVVHDLEIDGAVVVSTPQQLALADVRRGVEMFRAEGVGVPVLGIVENMAWFTPAELPDNRYYIFGRGGAREFASVEGIEFLGEVPIVQAVMESGERGLAVNGVDPLVKPYYAEVVRRIVDKVDDGC
jgi:ATP-binding protein involved in chromosome partitioning